MKTPVLTLVALAVVSTLSAGTVNVQETTYDVSTQIGAASNSNAGTTTDLNFFVDAPLDASPMGTGSAMLSYVASSDGVVLYSEAGSVAMADPGWSVEHLAKSYYSALINISALSTFELYVTQSLVSGLSLSNGAWSWTLEEVGGSAVVSSGAMPGLADLTNFGSASFSYNGVLNPGQYRLISEQSVTVAAGQAAEVTLGQSLLFTATSVPDATSSGVLAAVALLMLGAFHRRFRARVAGR